MSRAKVSAIILLLAAESALFAFSVHNANASPPAPALAITNLSPNPAAPGQLVTLNFTASDPGVELSATWVNWGDGSTPDLVWRLESGSMCIQGSTLCPGALLLFRKQDPSTITAEPYPNGTIIIFSPPCCSSGVNDPNYLVVHRVIGMGTPGACGTQLCFLTHGDNNPQSPHGSDPWDASGGVPPSKIVGVYQSTLSPPNQHSDARYDTHSYTQTGTFTVTVNATDLQGSSSSVTSSLLTVRAPRNPTAPQTVLGLSPTLFNVIVGATIILVLILGVAAFSRRGRRSPTSQAPEPAG